MNKTITFTYNRKMPIKMTSIEIENGQFDYEFENTDYVFEYTPSEKDLLNALSIIVGSDRLLSNTLIEVKQELKIFKNFEQFIQKYDIVDKLIVDYREDLKNYFEEQALLEESLIETREARN